MKQSTIAAGSNESLIVQGDLAGRIQAAITKTKETDRGFFVVVLQIENFEQFRKRRPAETVTGLMRELYHAVRAAVHPSQYVSVFQNGLAVVFDGVDIGHVDTISRRLMTLTQNVIRAGRYNDLTSHWSDILYQFLSSNPGILYSRVGWSIYPRDGESPADLLRRARNHAVELAR
jgi:hypothetical protein